MARATKRGVTPSFCFRFTITITKIQNLLRDRKYSAVTYESRHVEGGGVAVAVIIMNWDRPSASPFCRGGGSDPLIIFQKRSRTVSGRGPHGDDDGGLAVAGEGVLEVAGQLGVPERDVRRGAVRQVVHHGARGGGLVAPGGGGRELRKVVEKHCPPL